MSTTFNDNDLPDLTEQAINWLVRLHAHDFSDDEVHAFADWLSKDLSHAVAFNEAETLFLDMVAVGDYLTSSRKIPVDSKICKEVQQTDSGLSLKPLAKTKTARQPRHWLALPIGLAAVSLFVVLLVAPKQAQFFDDFFSDYHTSTGEQREVQLADGSRVLLNTNTAISVDYQDDRRLITLHHGQARFSVAKDGKRPFDVQTGDLSVRALGTIFEVYYQEAGDISLIVQEHAVSARLLASNDTTVSAENQPVDVKEGQLMHYTGGKSLPTPTSGDINQLTAWQQHRLMINNRPLQELIAELNRYRSGRIFLADANLNNLRVTGIFSLTNPEETLHKVSTGLALQETRLGPWWVVLHQ